MALQPLESERDQTFDRILAIAESRIAVLKPAILIDLNAYTPEAAKQAAEKESWSLLVNGLRHLKNGGPGGQAGMMTIALGKASLRSSALAASTGVQAPQFEQTVFSVKYKPGYEEAVFFATRLIEAAEGDVSKSTQLIRQKIQTGDHGAAYGLKPVIDDPELQRLLAIVAAGEGMETPDIGTNVSEKGTKAIRRQMELSLKSLTESYITSCASLKKSIADLTPPPQRPQPSRGANLDF